MTMSIPASKIRQISTALASFKVKYRVSKKQIQSLVGKLSWVARVIQAGRIYLRSLIEGMKRLKLAQHKLILTRNMKGDLEWWCTAIPLLNGTLKIKDNRPVTSMVMDACTMGCGASFAGDWFYNDWALDWPEAKDLHINYKEVLCAVLAARRWGYRWSNSKVVIYTDSTSAKGMLAKAKAKNSMVTEALKELFLFSIIFNFELVPVHLPGKLNLVADRLSRIRDRRAALELLTLLPLYTGKIVICHKHFVSRHVSQRVLVLLYLQGCPLIGGRSYYKTRWHGSGVKPTQNPRNLHIAPT